MPKKCIVCGREIGKNEEAHMAWPRCDYADPANPGICGLTFAVCPFIEDAWVCKECWEKHWRKYDEPVFVEVEDICMDIGILAEDEGAEDEEDEWEDDW